MQITYLFGNGLDISYGLKTSYSNFYDYLLQNSDNTDLANNLIFNELKKDYENHQKDLWKDYEVRLGEILNIIKDNQVDKIANDKCVIDRYLRVYLENEEKKVIIHNPDEIKINSFKQLLNLHKEVDVLKVEKCISDHNSETYSFNAISFNYTKTVKEMWGNRLKL